MSRRILVSKPRLCFLGPLVGWHPGKITAQALITANLFAAAGYPVASASSSLNRYVRLMDIAQTVVRKRKDIDIILLEVYGGPSFVVETTVAVLARVLRLPLVMVLHGGNLPVFFARFPAWSRSVLSQAKTLVAPSKYLIEAIRPYGFEPHFIPNVIDLDSYPYSARCSVRPRLMWMRSFHEIYNPEMAVEVAAALSQKHSDVQLVMAGPDKGLLSSVRKLADKLGVANRVQFPGFLDTQQKKNYFSQADIFINTNLIDNMPVAIVEACALGLPVVSTNVGGIPYLLSHEDTGLLVSPTDVSGMVDAVNRLVEDADLASRLSRNGRELAERSSWEQVRVLWEQLFAEVLDS